MILAQAFSRFVLDLDGVVWRAGEPIPGSPDAIRSLREAGKGLCFVTNNSSQGAEAYAKRLAEIGAGADPSEVVTSAHATVRVLEREVPGLRGRAVYVIGGPGLLEAVAGTGVRVVDAAEGADASVVVVGWDRRLTYDKLRVATLAIRRGAIFVATNTDATYPSPEGLLPGNGAAVAAIRTATGVRPIVAGKPEATMMELARERLGGSPALVVGDRVETDVLAARAAGWPSALVLSGATGVAELATAPAWPDYVLPRLADLLEDVPLPAIRPATGPDLPPIASLLHAGGMPAGAARERVGRTVVADVDRKPVATAAWDPVGDGVAILRSVAVAEGVRGRGVGTAVAAAAVRAAAAAGHRTVWLATAGAEDFFARCGFRAVRDDEVPDAIADHRTIAREAPSSATVMRLELPPA